jgi:hypothetical protein
VWQCPVVRVLPLLLLAAVAGGCGGGAKAVRYNERSALDCLQRTNSTLLVRGKEGIALAFMSDDGVSAIEPVYALFGSDRPTNAGTRALGIDTHEPIWTLDRGDVRVEGYGPYEPPVAKRHGIAAQDAKAAAERLDTDVHAAIDTCLKNNER